MIVRIVDRLLMKIETFSPTPTALPARLDGSDVNPASADELGLKALRACIPEFELPPPSRRLLQRTHSTIDDNFASHDVSGFIRSQQDDCLCNFADIAEPADRNLTLDLGRHRL